MKAKVSKQEVISKLKIDNKRTTNISHLNALGSYEVNVTPAPVEVPKMLADWIDQYDGENKGHIISEIGLAMYEGYYEQDTGWFSEYPASRELKNWLIGDDTNLLLVAEAIMYGYTVKPEQKWFVKVPHTTYFHYIDIPSFNIYYKGREGSTKASVQCFSKDELSTEYSDTQFTNDELKKYHLDGDDVERIEAK